MAIDDIGNQLSGSRASISVDGKVIAWANSASWNHNHAREPYQPLGNYEVREFVPVSYGGSITIGGVQLVSENLTTLGIQAQMGNSPQEHLRNVLAMPELTITIQDTSSNKVICVGYGCHLQSNSPSLQSAAMSNADINFYVKRIVEFGN